MSGTPPTTPTFSAPLTTRTVGAAFAAALLLTLTSCYEKNDPSYEKEVLRLTAEKAVVETRLEVSEKENKKLSSSLSTLRAEATDHRKKSSDETLAKLKKLEAALVKRDSDLLKLTQEMTALKTMTASQTTSPTPNPTPTPTTQPKDPKDPKSNPDIKKQPWKIEVDRGGGSGSQPTRRGQPTTPQKSGRKTTDPNAHKVDWGKAK